MLIVLAKTAIQSGLYGKVLFNSWYSIHKSMKQPQGQAPHIYTIGINKPQSLQLAAYGTILLFLSAALFSSLNPSSNQQINPIIGLTVYFITLAAHEAVHGFLFKIFGGEPQYGVGLMYKFFPYAYATSPGQPYGYYQMILIGLSPLFVVCTIALVVAALVPSLASYAAIAFVGNFAGAIGDIWLMGRLVRFRGANNLTFIDMKNGIEVHGSGDKADKIVKIFSVTDNPDTKKSKFMSRWLTSAALLVLVSSLLPFILSVLQFEGKILIGPEQFPLFEYVNNSQEKSFTFNPWPMVIAGLAFALIYEKLQFSKVIRRNI